MYHQLLKKHKEDFERVLDFLKGEVSQIRSGRATPALVEDVKVDAYGSKMRIKELANISIPDPKTILIQVWDKGIINSVEKAIQESHLGLNPVVDGQNIRLVVPPLIEERKKELLRLLHDKVEQARIKIRKIREEIWREVQDMEENGEIREDDKFKAKEDLQEMVDEFNEKIEEIKERKESELE